MIEFMNKYTNEMVAKYAENADLLNKLIVTAYSVNAALKINSGFLKKYLLDSSDKDYTKILCLSEIKDLEDVIKIFEQIIPSEEKIVNGAVYTPLYIREYIVSEVVDSSPKSLDKCLCADIACGCGAFLYTLALHLHHKSHCSMKDIIPRLYGVDINSTSVERTKILLSLMALQYGVIVTDEALHIKQGNTLAINFKDSSAVSLNRGFDIIVGNPPYVRAKNIDSEVKRSMRAWRVCGTGNPDLYIPFFEVGKSLLSENGKLGFITVNSFFKSVNARSLRDFFQRSRTSLKIIDFGQYLVFDKKLAYTCVIFISKNRETYIQYTQYNPNNIKDGVYPKKFNTIKYAVLNSHGGWRLGKENVVDNIQRIEQAGIPLGEKYIIKNGIATLANGVFIFRPLYSDSYFYYLEKDGRTYPVEKNICRDIIKPNILKSEKDIKEKEEKIIAPYNEKGVLLSEQKMRESFPMAYKYLSSQRTILDKRDKGMGNYNEWFAFGRTQAITDKGRKLLFPYMSDKPHFVYTPQSEMMIYCGYAIYNDSEEELLFLKRVLESSVFYYYIQHTSKPYASGYYSYAKNYVKSFGIYPFTPEDKKNILAMTDAEELDKFILSKYNITI